ncbi:uncharacterized protein BXZ73DRAFT_98005 [Epithele typhae]|uniref:uncharacterized protein n=1 Tax=Epithele typhae TaxID=378194 RepID=UPI0020074D69|nr:uncharacterized protein BXZ73DRAFT_98005 [Epithele typhae]KAH9941615.1 hypothetical protein BXZ73DRAFT_98005 [Epithele typhae]
MNYLIAFQRGVLVFHSVHSIYEVIDFLEKFSLSTTDTYSLSLYGIQERIPFDGERGEILASIDEAAVGRMVAHLPKLRHLSINDFRFLDSPTSPPWSAEPKFHTADPTRPGHPLPLNSLTVRRSTYGPGGSIHALLHILSLFHGSELDVRCSWDNFDPPTTDALHVPSPLRFASISFTLPSTSPWTVDGRLRALRFAEALRGLGDNLAPGWPRGKFEAQYDSPRALDAIGRILAKEGGSLHGLTLAAAAPRKFEWRGAWVDPLDEHWQRLQISSCTALVELTLHVFLRAHDHQAGPKYAASCAALLSALQSRHLQVLTIFIVDLSAPELLRERFALGAVDAALKPERFPALNKVVVFFASVQQPDGPVSAFTPFQHAVVAQLPLLFARGILVVQKVPIFRPLAQRLLSE